jgi:hypothetical protein
MVGLRERTALTKQDEESLADTADVDWKEALFGKKFRRVKGNEEEEERKAIQEWAQGGLDGQRICKEADVFRSSDS